MPENEIKYEEDLLIDPEQLDVEWLDQPRKFMRYAEEAAKAKREMDRAKEHCDVVYAEQDSKIRINPERYDIAKVTADSVKATVLQQEAYKKAQMKYNDTKFDYDIAMAAVRAFDMRKSALENLVKLQGQSYFAAPSEPRDLPAEYSKRGMKAERGADKLRKSARASRE